MKQQQLTNETGVASKYATPVPSTGTGNDPPRPIPSDQVANSDQIANSDQVANSDQTANSDQVANPVLPPVFSVLQIQSDANAFTLADCLASLNDFYASYEFQLIEEELSLSTGEGAAAELGDEQILGGLVNTRW